MDARIRDRRKGLIRRRTRIGAAILAVATAATIAGGCTSDTVVNTDDGPATTEQASAPTARPPAKRPTNDNLANAFDYYAQAAGNTGYYFTSPSKRWMCAIFPRRSAGCQSATGSAIAVTGAPTSVPDFQDTETGTDTAPNAIQVDRAAGAGFASLDPPGYALVPGPAVVLPFGKVLAVAGFRCNVQETSGISCLSELTGKGFTFSADGYTFTYSDLPG